MIINTKYNLNQKIYIPELKVSGIIIGISYYYCLKYDVRYFDGRDKKECYFLEEELSEILKETELGFNKI